MEWSVNAALASSNRICYVIPILFSSQYLLFPSLAHEQFRISQISPHLDLLLISHLISFCEENKLCMTWIFYVTQTYFIALEIIYLD